MKKVIALIMAALFCLICIAYADDTARRQPAIEIYDFDGNRVENPDWDNLWQYGAVFDVNGNIVPQTRGGDYVNSEIKLDPNGVWVSYQYRVSYGNAIHGGGICKQGGVKVEKELALSVGGTRSQLGGNFLSTTEDIAITSWEQKTEGSVYINFVYSNLASSARTFKIHIWT